MKIKLVSAALLAGAAVLCSSCVVPMEGMGTFSYSTDGYNTSVAWTNASYDSAGFPIYGYSYGRPVYGYSASGVAIFTLAALTAACYVPHWGPAPWYHGTWHYPAHIHRAPAPPRFPHGHMPAQRPIGGLHAPIHHNPGSIMGPPRGPSHAPAPGNHRPILGGNNKPGGSNPAGNRGGNLSRPAGRSFNSHTVNHNFGSRPSGGGSGFSSRPSGGGGHSFSSRPSGGSSRPSGGGHSARPAAGGRR